MVLKKCQYKVDCIFCKTHEMQEVCTLLSDTTFKYPCPFYKTRAKWVWDNQQQEWVKKNGNK